MPERFKLSKKYTRAARHVLHLGDCIDLLEKMPKASVDLTVTSPPYCIGKEYESTRDVNDFVHMHTKLLPEIARVTKDGGSICWQVGYHVQDRSIVPLDYLVYDICKSIPGLHLRNRIIWTYGHGLNETARFTGRHETVLWFTKGDGYKFNLDAVRVPQKYPGKRAYKGPNKGEFSGNPLGKNPTDIWDIPNVKSMHKEKTEHPCQYPIALAHRLISALSNIEDVVLDPFSGAGTTGAASVMLGRRFVGAEIDASYWDIASERMLQAATGTLPYRDIDLPVFDPRKAGVVAKKPEHFKWTADAVK